MLIDQINKKKELHRQEIIEQAADQFARLFLEQAIYMKRNNVSLQSTVTQRPGTISNSAKDSKSS